MIASGLIAASLLTLATGQNCSTALVQCFGGFSIIDGDISLNVLTQLCNNLDSSQVCLAGVQGDDVCQNLVDGIGALTSYTCASSYADVLDGYNCISGLDIGFDCDVPEYDGMSPIGSYHCSLYTQYLGCFYDEIDQNCTGGNEWAKRYVAISYTVSVAQIVSPDCPLLQYLGGGVSGPVSSAWLTTGLLLAGIAMMRMLTT